MEKTNCLVISKHIILLSAMIRRTGLIAGSQDRKHNSFPWNGQNVVCRDSR